MRTTVITATMLLILSAFASAAYRDIPDTLPSTQPGDDLGRLALRANEFFTNGQYDLALPLLQRMSASYADQPDRQGPIEEDIRVCRKNLATPTTQPAAQSTAPLIANTPARKPHPAIGPSEVYDVTLEGLGNFPYDDQTGGIIPDDVKALDGKHVRITGCMVPVDQAANITRFALLGSPFACACQYGGAPHIRHTVFVTTPDGKAVAFCADRIVVEGILHVREQKDDGYVTGLFDLDATSIRATK